MVEARYILSLRGLPDGEFDIVYTLDDSFLAAIEGFDIFGGGVKVTLEGTRSGDNFEIDFVLEGTVRTLCDRCNAPLDAEIEAVFPMSFALGAETKEVSDSDFMVSRNEPEMGLDEILWQLVVLAMPMRKVHEEGACSEEVESFFLHQQQNAKDPRWADLEQIQFDK